MLHCVGVSQCRTYSCWSVNDEVMVVQIIQFISEASGTFAYNEMLATSTQIRILRLLLHTTTRVHLKGPRMLGT